MQGKKKVIYEIFNTTSGVWEESVLSEEELQTSLQAYQEDFQIYEAERNVVNEILDQILNPNVNKSRD